MAVVSFTGRVYLKESFVSNTSSRVMIGSSLKVLKNWIARISFSKVPY
jgi:hypothetical protein